MAAVHERRRRNVSRRTRRAAGSGRRLDIQGLRMVAVVAVFANHLLGWPRGGFVGVDVFFVISGFLITGNLLRMAETDGNVSFGTFYWNRIRRIVPAATVVLLLTCVATMLVFQPFRSHQVGIDALYAFVFLANWHFALQGTNYFQQGNAVSPLQHYWSLSIEEQFYFVWPAVVFVICVLVVGRAWSHGRRMFVAGGVMSVIVIASFAWATFETANAPQWAYFSTFSRAWELGFGALLAIGSSRLARIPTVARPVLSWAGLGCIAGSVWFLADGAPGFPAPWAALPVVGAAMVIAAGVNGEPRYQLPLRNRLSTYVGDISYSLYLVHWPVIVILGAVMDVGAYYYFAVTATAFGLAIASYHLVENPLRRFTPARFHRVMAQIDAGHYQPKRSTQLAAVSAAALLIVGLTAFVVQPAEVPASPPDLAAAAQTVADPAEATPAPGPLAAALGDQILASLKATEWPSFDPPAASVIKGPIAVPDVFLCGAPTPPTDRCTWGDDAAPLHAVLLGDSVAMAYLGPLRDIALNSAGRLQLHSEAQYGCEISDDVMENDERPLVDACPATKQRAIDYINDTRPDIVFISNTYTEKIVDGSHQVLTAQEWGDSVRTLVDAFRGNVDKVVFLSAPPADLMFSECYGKRSSVPADCISRVTRDWLTTSKAERDLAAAVGGTWIDARPWFCGYGRLCPSFVGNTPTKVDAVHMTPEYGEKISPVIAEALSMAGVT